MVVLIFLAFPNAEVFAQLGSVPVGHPGLGQDGIAGGIQDSIAKVALSAVESSLPICIAPFEVGLSAIRNTNFAFGGLSLISGNSSEVALIESKLRTIDGVLTCRTTADGALKKVPTPNLFISQKKQRFEEENNASIQTYKKLQEDLQIQLNIAKRGFWKSLVVVALLNTSKSISQKMVNNLSNTYKIKDFQKYADVVGGQIYTTQLIQKSNNKASEQMMLKSALKNSTISGQVPALVSQKADTALGFDPDKYDSGSPSFYFDMAKAGSNVTNKYVLNVDNIDKAYQMSAQGRTDASAEIVQSNGLKASRTSCGDNVAAQQAVDSEFDAVARKYEDRRKLYQQLIETKQTVLNLTDNEKAMLEADIKRAEADFNKTAEEMEKISEKYSAGSGAALDVCKGIAAPTSLVNMAIDKAFGAFTKGLGDFNDNNLPFFTKFISEIGTNVTNNLVFGGNVKNTLLAETGNIEKGIGTGVAFATMDTSNLVKGITFNYEKSNNFADAYVLTWDVQAVKDASFVTIKGTGISDTQRLPLSGSGEIRTSASNSYLLKVFNSTGRQLESASVNLEVVQPANPYLNSSGPGTTLGISITKELISIRGPVGVSLR